MAFGRSGLGAVFCFVELSYKIMVQIQYSIKDGCGQLICGKTN
ncbi:hypothetical protein HMPREF9104_00534 [Lentilactobacillus kisonensis F0435]|uniref:Uncharacterized protein n=1 Tax=Lentilactobacillus kisonensis F0435 TaxID=797516 RepID=H1LD70_9LACO|nr:hypothetical protein HMPREF9104_00534 [Lentilactobacillus kisonensis F0435]